MLPTLHVTYVVSVHGNYSLKISFLDILSTLGNFTVGVNKFRSRDSLSPRNLSRFSLNFVPLIFYPHEILSWVSLNFIPVIFFPHEILPWVSLNFVHMIFIPHEI